MYAAIFRFFFYFST
ncbi:TPA: pheST operon leader peptide PheM [Klebsiella oxytoca]|nr:MULTISPECIES: pheST operon leader peptide PheM [Enterobacterales]QMI07183.1 pheST operon leader peptide PheM [Citrobacter sp. RHB25-C09]HCH7899580.1 pheST operon leader peptide PheM [Klebsiella oxytoca]